jgi:hypothetical protein
MSITQSQAAAYGRGQFGGSGLDSSEPGRT